MVRRTGIQVVRQIYVHTGRQVVIQACSPIGKQKNKQTRKQTYGQAVTQVSRQTGRQEVIPSGSHTDRQS